MTLENVVRGSTDIGAMVSTGWGVRKLTADDDQTRNAAYVQNIKPRDFLPPEPFLIRLRPDIDERGLIGMEKKPGECGSMAEEIAAYAGPDKKAWAHQEWKKNPKIGRPAINALIKERFGSGVKAETLGDWLTEWKGQQAEMPF